MMQMGISDSGVTLKEISLEAAVHRSLPKIFCEQENTEHESINKPLHPTCHRFPVVCYLPCLFAVVKWGCKEANFFSDCLQLVNAIKNSTFWLPHSANSVAHNLAAWAASHNVARPLLERELVDEYERYDKSITYEESAKSFIKSKELAECLMKTRIYDDDDVVKLTKVFIMHNILQNKRGQCHVDNFVMKLVDDEQMFENYPWGRRSFNDTVNSLSTILNRQKIGYEICGFPLAFQVWGFEILPSLGSSFVIKISCVPWAPVDDNRSTTAEQIRLNHDSSSPRMNDIRTNLRKRD
ncbi:hypothetical protein G4B88_002191 [Cannabis sativa]|uniref:DUF1985 domain-containing protein n=1 Tax=Cannabis sativa TaxID=3483 RepID=A0A7J6E119_CANSA|nr:hypothetical protein G4B88_002191 [Cannabis sativa]